MNERSGVDRLAEELVAAVDRHGFSGVVVLRQGERVVLERAWSLADRAQERPMTVDTRLATASGTKGFTALTAVSMVAEGRLDFDTPVADIVGADLPLVDPGVTVEHLLGHTSGIGDYLDEEELDAHPDGIDAHVLDVPVHALLGPEDYLPLLAPHRQREEPGRRFRYNNSGYVVLALVIERVGERSYHDEVRDRVFGPAGLTATDFLRSDRLPADTALGYLTDGRTNVFHLPVIGTGDGGAYTTGPDLIRFWDALFGGRIVDRSLVARMTSVLTDEPPDRYGLGFWVGPDRVTAVLEGMDAGVSLRTGAHPTSGFRFCLLANNSSDVWPLARIVSDHLAAAADPA